MTPPHNQHRTVEWPTLPPSPWTDMNKGSSYTLIWFFAFFLMCWQRVMLTFMRPFLCHLSGNSLGVTENQKGLQLNTLHMYCYWAIYKCQRGHQPKHSSIDYARSTQHMKRVADCRSAAISARQQCLIKSHKNKSPSHVSPSLSLSVILFLGLSN